MDAYKAIRHRLVGDLRSRLLSISEPMPHPVTMLTFVKLITARQVCILMIFRSKHVEIHRQVIFAGKLRVRSYIRICRVQESAKHGLGRLPSH